MEKTALYCGECLRYLRYANEGEDFSGYEGDEVLRWIVCDRCLERQANPGRVVGAQPAVCLECREPFGATRQGQKFCSSACRARAWRQREKAQLTP
jgi:hypothetical protein